MDINIYIEREMGSGIKRLIEIGIDEERESDRERDRERERERGREGGGERGTETAVDICK